MLWLLWLHRLLGYSGCLKILVFLFLQRLLTLLLVLFMIRPCMILLSIYALMPITRVHMFRMIWLIFVGCLQSFRWLISSQRHIPELRAHHRFYLSKLSVFDPPGVWGGTLYAYACVLVVFGLIYRVCVRCLCMRLCCIQSHIESSCFTQCLPCSGVHIRA